MRSSARISGTPPTRVATAGRPAAAASISATGSPSLREVRSSASRSAQRRGHVVDRAHQVRAAALVRGQRADLALEHAARVAVAEEDELQARVARREQREDLEGPFGALDVRQAAEDADDEGLGAGPEQAPQRAMAAPPRAIPGAVLDGQERRELDSRRHDHQALFLDHAQAHEVVGGGVRDGHDAVGAARQAALERQETARERLGEVALEHVAVERVDPRGGERARCRPAEGPGLGGVRVDQVGGELAERPPQEAAGLEVARHSPAAPEARHAHDVEAELHGAGEEVALAGLRRAGEEAHLVAAPREQRIAGERLARGAAQVQARQDAGDAHVRESSPPERALHALGLVSCS